MDKLRVWWIPQMCAIKSFYVPVKTVEEGKKVMDMLAAYDAYQRQNRIKPDYCNCGGLQMWDEEEKEWCDWYTEEENNYFDNVDDYCKQCGKADELEEFNRQMFAQIDWEKIKKMSQ
nr:MAG TPA: Superinfection exclusion protein [Caudoviricetes sp.]